MRREGFEIARCTPSRLMRSMELKGAVRGKRVRTTVPDPAAPCPRDRVNRVFRASAPNRPGLSGESLRRRGAVMKPLDQAGQA
jgi:hypothetical protein